MRILRCCVIDDEPLAARLINDYIEKTPFLESAGIFGSAQEAIRPRDTKNVNAGAAAFRAICLPSGRRAEGFAS